MTLNLDSHIWCLGTYAERYVPGGYFDPLTLDEQLQIMSGIEGLTGLFVFYPSHPLPSDPDSLLRKLAGFNLKVSNLMVDCWGDRKWKHGGFATTDARVRKETVKLFEDAIDFSRAIKAESVLLWPAHDGFDYPFQCDYRDGWKHLVETIREVVYVGRAFMCQENPAESLAILYSHGKLGQIHLNESYRDADPDMIFGTVNFWENLEFFYYLNRTRFTGWATIDAVIARDDRARSLEMAVSMAWKYKRMADILSARSAEIDAHLAGYRFADNAALITELLLKG